MACHVYLLVKSVVTPVRSCVAQYNTPHRYGGEYVPPRSDKVGPVKILLSYCLLYVLSLLSIYSWVLCWGVIHKVEPPHHPHQATPTSNIEHCLPPKIVCYVPSKGEDDQSTKASTGPEYALKSVKE